ncbi:uncharacterized protein F5147DRAFT_169515 [Suillus discolor]|uniref:Uncharacterized protein n=1 Tax=Suillus discolor TaxID=1912936 RepID=A0A9P7F6C2_9AGAM|nr:uncharacterized protein F5147DRAFT_169515 [Suillus discolor]KAG2108375.1 hypothetical protein F5147DRAFT_169515 [Suillus discolor]
MLQIRSIGTAVGPFRRWMNMFQTLAALQLSRGASCVFYAPDEQVLDEEGHEDEDYEDEPQTRTVYVLLLSCMVDDRLRFDLPICRDLF